MKLFNQQPQSLEAGVAGETCACGHYKGSSRLIVCGDCWFRVPREVRHQVEFGSRTGKRIAAEVVLGFARARKQDLEAKFIAVPGWKGGPRPHVRD